MRLPARRPWNLSLLRPALPERTRPPRMARNEQRRPVRRPTMQRLPLLRPRRVCPKLTVVVAGSESCQEIVVPTGGWRRRASEGRREPSRETLGETKTLETDGASVSCGAVTTGAKPEFIGPEKLEVIEVEGAALSTVHVRVASETSVLPAASLALTEKVCDPSDRAVRD